MMITGDHKDTAAAIARQLGIIQDASQAITGADLDEISDEELDQKIENYSVYARVQPEHKVRIVKAWKARGKITAMTGDGVNDAPSIKSADIGVGMGITGTDVYQECGGYGAGGRQFCHHRVSSGGGAGGFMTISASPSSFCWPPTWRKYWRLFAATMFGFTILRPVHLLWINLITDCFPALALGMEKSESDIMKRTPRDPKDGIFAGGMGFDVVFQGAVVTVMVLLSYFIGHYVESGRVGDQSPAPTA